MADDMVSRARDNLFKGIVGIMPEGRVHRVVPKQVVSPCMWIERPRLFPRYQGKTRITVAALSIAIVVDGDDKAQQDELDNIVAQTWDAAESVPYCTPFNALARPIDIGGPIATAMFVDTETIITARTLCQP